MTAPQDQTQSPPNPAQVVVWPNDSVNCSVNTATAYDTWTFRNLSGQADDDPITYKWNWGATGPTASCTAPSSGMGEVVCTATAGSGAIGSYDGGTRGGQTIAASVPVSIVSASFTGSASDRMWINGTASIGVVLTPTPTSGAASVAAVGGGGVSVSPGSLSASGNVTLTGTANSKKHGDMTIRVSHGTTVMVTSSPFTVSTEPLSMKVSTAHKADRYGITTQYTFVSESGSANDLGNCYYQESVAPGGGNTGTITSQSQPNQMNGAGTLDYHDIPEASLNLGNGSSLTAAASQSILWWNTIYTQNSGDLLDDTAAWAINPIPPSLNTYNGYTVTTTLSGGYSDSVTETGP